MVLIKYITNSLIRINATETLRSRYKLTLNTNSPLFIARIVAHLRSVCINRGTFAVSLYLVYSTMAQDAQRF